MNRISEGTRDKDVVLAAVIRDMKQVFFLCFQLISLSPFELHIHPLTHSFLITFRCSPRRSRGRGSWRARLASSSLG